MRVWTLPVEPLLTGGLGTLPLAPISAVAPAELPDVLGGMKRRLAKHHDRGLVGRLWSAVYVLLGLRYEQAVVERLLEGVLGMKESTTYQAIIAEGRAEGAREELRKMLLAQGEERFGTPAPAGPVRELNRIESLEQLEALAKQVLRVHSWPELLPRTHKPGRSRKNGA